MPIQLDYDLSRKRFEAALALARSNARLPQEWLERTTKVGQSPSKTFVAMLGTALLAKATDRKVDPFSLKTREFPTAYSARALCKDVLVPCAVAAGVHLGTTGREPLNNQPFFRYERIGPDMMVKGNARPHLDYLCETLTALSRLDDHRSLLALAAFLRVRAEAGAASMGPLSLDRVLELPELVSRAAAFVTANPEGGRRGQALVAACLDLVFEGVRTTRVNDPSRHWPGDVVVIRSEKVILSAEVKQRPASASEIAQFAGRCAEMGVFRAVVAALDPDQDELYVDEVREQAWNHHAVHLSVLEGVTPLIHSSLTWSHHPLAEAVAELPQRMAVRLQELEVSAEGQAEWAELFKAEP